MWLDEAFEERSEWRVWIRVDQKVNTLRSDPRFSNLLERVGYGDGVG